MQDYGQTGGAAYPPQGGAPMPPPGGAPPPPKKKCGKGLMIIGVVLLIVGLIIALVGAMPMMTYEKAEDMKQEDVKSGDTYQITGEITEEVDVSDLGILGVSGYGYTLDKEIGVLSSEDIGGKGDTVYLECEGKDLGAGLVVLEVKTQANPLPIIIVGVILLIVGILLIVVNIIKGKKAKKAAAPGPAPGPAPQQPMYPPQQPQQPPQYGAPPPQY